MLWESSMVVSVALSHNVCTYSNNPLELCSCKDLQSRILLFKAY